MWNILSRDDFPMSMVVVDKPELPMVVHFSPDERSMKSGCEMIRRS